MTILRSRADLINNFGLRRRNWNVEDVDLSKSMSHLTTEY